MNEQNRIFNLVNLVVWIIAIACTLILVFQNLQPLVTIYFLGKFTIPIPLSLAILAAFLIGGISAFIVNLIGFWLSPKEEEIETDEEFPPEPLPNPQKPKPSAYKSNYVDSVYDKDQYDDDDDVIDVKYIDR
ncbi:hypothetical protein Syn7502_02034 [Synechococcus sp. PCC 7502]|uniref:LapA family protein n=1 Tax=Synechococcus sp. PCC 7502 TaxID=1173263 RepID=UPI00029FB619|nr:LapA family protein [Synechococcus sp. PCC 7502]AFY74058.1 hypothetical protein Syn7502_02034 [Synechococcus sp. PCC 7502]